MFSVGEEGCLSCQISRGDLLDTHNQLPEEFLVRFYCTGNFSLHRNVLILSPGMEEIALAQVKIQFRFFFKENSKF